jgi:probable HAF family extracellular repeat protein
MKRNAVVLAVVLLGIMILIDTHATAVAQLNQPKDVRYTVTEVGVLPGYESSYLPILGSINNGGFVAGYSYNGPLDGSSIDFYLTSRAFIGDHRGVVTLLPTPNGYAGANAFGLNDRNQVFGMANKLDDNGNLLVSPVVWDQYRNPTLLENLTTPYYDVWAMSNNGDVVGDTCLDPDCAVVVPVYWHRGRIAQLPLPDGAVNGYATAINDSGVIVGQVDYGSAPPAGTGEYHMYAWIPRGGHYVGSDLGDNSALYVIPNAINNLGQIAGGMWDGVSDRAFVWTDGQLKDLGPLPGGKYSWTWSINIGGQVLGQSDRPGQSDTAVVWQDDTIIDLNDVVPPGTPTLVTPGGINDVGQIAVDSYSRHYTTTRAFILTPVADDSH